MPAISTIEPPTIDNVKRIKHVCFSTSEHQQLTISQEFPTKEWANVTSPEKYGLSAEVRERVDAMLDGLSTTSFMAVAAGKALYTYGDVSEVSYLASTRKSILSMLFGKAVAEGKIDLDLTMADLNIDEDHGLLPIEKTATLRNLLISSSGVYHQPGSPGSNTKNIPERGSKKPGDYFHYNNWDFNVLGAAFEQLTGRSVFEAFEEDFAGPMGLQDFDPSPAHDGLRRRVALSCLSLLPVGQGHGATGSVDGAQRSLG